MVILYRSYAKTIEQAPEVVLRALASARIANQVGFDRTLLVVAVESDCGVTAERLTTAISAEQLNANVVHGFGSPNRDVLNQAFHEIHGMSAYVAVVSHKASEYLSVELLKRASLLLQSGFKVVGVRIGELDDVQEVAIANTLAFWDVDAVLEVGGFDSDIGVEEIAVLARLMKLSHRPAALISVLGTEPTLNIRKSTEGMAKHKEVKDTKRARQEQEAIRAGVTLDLINERICVL